MSPLNITQPLGIWSIRVYNGYYKVMSNIPKMGQLPTPVDDFPKKPIGGFSTSILVCPRVSGESFIHKR